MRSPRRFLSSAVLTLAVLGLGACASISGGITGRNLECTATPVDLCIRIADYVTTTLPREFSANPKVKVGPRACDADEAGDTGCWRVDVAIPNGSTDAMVHQHADGTLGSHWTSNGSPPDT